MASDEYGAAVAKLQAALLAGKIDQKMYHRLKDDLVRAEHTGHEPRPVIGSQPPRRRRGEESEPATKPGHEEGRSKKPGPQATPQEQSSDLSGTGRAPRDIDEAHRRVVLPTGTQDARNEAPPSDPFCKRWWLTLKMTFARYDVIGTFGLLIGYSGLVILVAGLGLGIGNQTGYFPTFPYAGFLTMAVGGLLAWIGMAMNR